MTNSLLYVNDKGGVGKSLVYSSGLLASEQLGEERLFFECEHASRLGLPDRYGSLVRLLKLPNEPAGEFDEGAEEAIVCFDPILRHIRLRTALSVDFGANAFARFLAAARRARLPHNTDGGRNVGVVIVATTAPDPLEGAFAAAADVLSTLPNAQIFWVENSLNGRFEDLRGSEYDTRVKSLNATVLTVRHLRCRGWKFVQAQPLDKLAELTGEGLSGFVDVEEAERSSSYIQDFALHLIRDIGMPVAKWAASRT